MTTNDKPVCYQCQVCLGGGKLGPWLSYDTAAERDARVDEHLHEGRACYTRDLYDRPQPAAPQVPEGWVLVRRKDAEDLARFGRNHCGNGLRSYIRDAADRVTDALATPPAAKPEQGEPDWRELCRRLYVELFYCDQQMTSSRAKWKTGATVRAVLDDAKAALAAQPKPAGVTTGQAAHAMILASYIGTREGDTWRFDGAQLRQFYMRVLDEQPKPAGEAVDAEDAARYRWLRGRLLSADFSHDDHVALAFALPAGTIVRADTDAIIDYARRLSGQEG